MANSRFRPFLYAAVGLVAVWAAVWAAYAYAHHMKMTAEKVRAYALGLNLDRLSADARAKSLKELADRINSLSPDERQKWRQGGEWKDLFNRMTEEERGNFIDATLPSGFKQALDAFSQMPPEKRKKMVDNALTKMKEDAAAGMGPGTPNSNPNGPQLSPELEQKVRGLGLKVLYSQSSPETRADLAPLVEEIQRQVTHRNQP